MIKAILIVLSLTLFSLFGTYVVSPVTQVGAQASLACDGLEGATENDNCGSGSSAPSIKKIISAVLNILSLVAGVIAVIMIIIAGTKFITSQGDAGKVASARSTAIYAIIGLVIVALSQTIVFFVLREATATPATEDASVVQVIS